MKLTIYDFNVMKTDIQSEINTNCYSGVFQRLGGCGKLEFYIL